MYDVRYMTDFWIVVASNLWRISDSLWPKWSSCKAPFLVVKIGLDLKVLYLYRNFVLLPRDSYYRILFYLDLSFIHGSWRTTCIAGTGRKHCRLLIAVNWYCEHKLVYELKNLLGRAEQDDNSRRVSCLLHQRFKHGGCPIRPGLWNSEPTEEDMHQTWCVDLVVMGMTLVVISQSNLTF